MDCGELILVDVGHGNCAIIKHGTEAIIIDAPGRPIVAKVLDDLGITSIHALLISHADSDHLSGAIPILMNPLRPVKHVYVNPDDRDTSSWYQFRVAAADARKVRGTAVHASLNIDDPQNFSLSGTTLEVLHPSPEICLATNGGKHTDGITLDANSMSAVILVQHDGERICLLAADAGRHSLDLMIKDGTNLTAKVLVFPHHGGHVAGTKDSKTFAKDIVSSVQPQLVVFSLGRGVHATPRPEIISGVREAMSGNVPYIACTQISKNCSDAVPGPTARPLNKHSEGLAKNHCCAGTVVLPLKRGGADIVLNELNEHHGKFLTTEVPKALCRKNLAPASTSSVISIMPKVT